MAAGQERGNDGRFAVCNYLQCPVPVARNKFGAGRGGMTNEARGVASGGGSEIEIIGDVYPVVRVVTGLWSFDRALGFRGENGVPLRSLIELYGHEHSGKSTLGWFISSKVSPAATVWIADIEGTLDKVYIKEVMKNAGFTGTVRVADYEI